MFYMANYTIFLFQLFESNNLLDTDASSQSKFVTAIMEKLFTAQERLTGIIADDKSVSKRTRLYPERVAILKGKIHLLMYYLVNLKFYFNYYFKICNHDKI